jgi:hypothetical protein
MGGDEFCVLLPAGADPDLIAAGVTQRTGTMEITATCGSVALSPAMSVAEALTVVDERLYSRKRRRACGSDHQAATALAPC